MLSPGLHLVDHSDDVDLRSRDVRDHVEYATDRRCQPRPLVEFPFKGSWDVSPNSIPPPGSVHLPGSASFDQS